MDNGKEKSVTKKNGDGSITKIVLSDDGRYIIEIDSKNGANQVAFSIRGVIESTKLHRVLQEAELFFKKDVTDSKQLGN